VSGFFCFLGWGMLFYRQISPRNSTESNGSWGAVETRNRRILGAENSTNFFLIF
jgi:hypothetical protein